MCAHTVSPGARETRDNTTTATAVLVPLAPPTRRLTLELLLLRRAANELRLRETHGYSDTFRILH
eukprot:4471488-Prymnesium_polylepis.1